MNERIKELAEQAYNNFVSGCSYTNINPIFPELRDKFAELIVKECAIIANRADNTDTEIRCMYDVITEHFGVK